MIPNLKAIANTILMYAVHTIGLERRINSLNLYRKCLIENGNTYLNSSNKLGPGCSRVAVLSEHSEASSGAEGELPARSVR